MSVCGELLASLRPRSAEMLGLIEELVKIEAGSYDAVQVEKVGPVLPNGGRFLAR